MRQEQLPGMKVAAKTHLVWDDQNLLIIPRDASLEKNVLTFTRKVLGQDPKRPWKKVSRRKRVKFYEIVSRDGVQGILTMQGMWHKVTEHLKSRGVEFTFTDTRSPLPAPKLERMSGFRFSQEELITKALEVGCSGCVEAPTRYGKTTLMINTLRAYEGVCAAVIVPGNDLVRQTLRDYKLALPHREIVAIGSEFRTKFQSSDITICSMDSMHKLDPDNTRLILVDEPQDLPTDGRLPKITAFTRARRIGFSATLTGRFDKADILLEAALGPVLARKTYLEAVAEGAICPLHVFFIRVAYEPRYFRDRAQAYHGMLTHNPNVQAIMRWLSSEVIPADWQMLFFIANESDADALAEAIPGAIPIAMAKKFAADRKGKCERSDMLQDMAAGSIKRSIASSIYAKGVTFSHLRSMVNAAGGGASTSSIQKPGRLAEVRPDKKIGIIFDFMFVPRTAMTETGESELDDGIDRYESACLWRESIARYNVYRDKGYSLHICDTRKKLTQALKQALDHPV